MARTLCVLLAIGAAGCATAPSPDIDQPVPDPVETLTGFHWLVAKWAEIARPPGSWIAVRTSVLPVENNDFLLKMSSGLL